MIRWERDLDRWLDENPSAKEALTRAVAALAPLVTAFNALPTQTRDFVLWEAEMAR